MAIQTSPDPRMSTTGLTRAARNRDLQKTKLCNFYLQGACEQGTSCSFAHDVSEIKHAPDLRKTKLCAAFGKGNCFKDNCTYAHGEAEIVQPPSFKQKLCAWNREGKCQKGVECGFAHSISELPADLRPTPSRTKSSKKPVSEVSTDVPSSLSLVESGISTIAAPPLVVPPPGLPVAARKRTGSGASLPGSQKDSWKGSPAGSQKGSPNGSQKGSKKGSPPPGRAVPTAPPSATEEHFFRMMAGRGSAPLQKQVQSMSAAIGDLQKKLAQLEQEAMQTKVGQMNEDISHLSQQCLDIGANLATTQQPRKTKAANLATTQQPRKTKACSKGGESAMWMQVCQNHDVRAALGVLVLAMLAIAAMTLSSVDSPQPSGPH